MRHINMINSEQEKQVTNSLESSCKKSNNEQIYWLARDIQETLGYISWSKFTKVIDKAIASCDVSEANVSDHFVHWGKMITLGKGGRRKVDDYILSKYACYLIAMNGDSSKHEIATAQRYFALQTIKMEQNDEQAEASGRIELRSKVKEANKSLGDAAKDAGVNRYALFHNAGYKGLYGMSLKNIKAKKEIGTDDLLDRSGHSELAANYFRITQADEKIRGESISGERAASKAHHDVGVTIRETIISIGGTLPEDLPAEENIKTIIKKETKKISSG